MTTASYPALPAWAPQGSTDHGQPVSIDNVPAWICYARGGHPAAGRPQDRTTLAHDLAQTRSRITPFRFTDR